jgi:hypothetical protein
MVVGVCLKITVSAALSAGTLMIELWKHVAMKYHAMDHTTSTDWECIRGWRGFSRGVAAAQQLKCG